MDYDVDIRVHRSDCWDEGNSMTRFYEYDWKCPGCGLNLSAYERPESAFCNNCEYREIFKEEMMDSVSFFLERKGIEFDKQQLKYYANSIAEHLEKILNEKRQKTL